MTDNNNTKNDRNKLSAVWNAEPNGIGLDDKITIIENWSYEALKYLPPWIMPEAIESDGYYFVAHSRQDFKIVYTDILRLESVGVDIWYDRSMEPGRNWQEIAERMMNRQECKGVIVYGTVNSMASKPVQIELLVADKLGKNIIFINHGEDLKTTAAKDLYEKACKKAEETHGADCAREETSEEDRERVERFEELLTRIGNADITYIDLSFPAARKKELLDAIKPEEVLIYGLSLGVEITGVKYIGVKSVKIPEKATVYGEQYDVTRIGACAFANCRALEEIELPETLEKIGEHAFFYCKSLTRVRLGRNISYVAENAFENCDNLMSISAQREGTVVIRNRVCYCRPFNNETPYIFFVPPNLKGRVVLLKGLKDIKPRAFYKREGVTAVEIPNSVTNIGKSAFAGCISLVSVTIGNSVMHIDDNAFRDCAALTSITIPNSVTGIGECAFAGCTSLTSVTIPDSVTSIDSFAFNGCTSLSFVDIPDSVTSIGWGVFRECSALTSLIVAEGNPKYHSAGNCLIETETKMLVKGCDNSIIPSGGSVKHIGFVAYSGCNSLTSVTIPYGVTSIDSFAFNGCTSLSFVDIPDSVIVINGSAFQGCASLTSLTIPVSVEMLGFCLFPRCVSLKSINYAGTVKQWRELIAEWRFWAKGSSCEVVKCKDGEVPVTEHDRKISYDYKFEIDEPDGDEEE